VEGGYNVAGAVGVAERRLRTRFRCREKDRDGFR